MAPDASKGSPPDAGGAVAAPRRLSSRKALWQAAGLALAAALAWLAWRGYRQPDLLFDFVMRLC